MRTLMSGNEAIARGAWEAGVKVATAYPGTPSTEILQNVALYKEIYAEWSANEKVALDTAIGAAYAGQRAMAAMKHVGLNVASESLFYSSYTGINAGLVVITADDPGLHSSQNEQDNRHYARFAKVPMLEPADSQEAKDFVKLGIELSEKFDTPVLVRTTTRTSHAKSAVDLRDRQEVPKRPYVKNPPKYVMIPGYAKMRHPVVEERMLKLRTWAEDTEINTIEWGDRSMGIITAGIAYQYAREIFPHASIMKLGMVWPLPEDKFRQFNEEVSRLYVLEELDPFLEESVRALGIPVEGKSIFPMIDELTPEQVRESAIKANLISSNGNGYKPDIGPLPRRPPVLCAGCGHRDVFWSLRQLKVAVNSDIGCYALGVLPPLESTDTIGCMGASIGVAIGMRHAGLEKDNVAVIGDSTFFHAGLPALATAIYNKTPLVLIVVDNRTTGMTGHQGNPGSGETLMGQTTGTRIDIGAVARAMGVPHVYEVEGREIKGLQSIVKEALKTGETAVIVANTVCVFVASHNREAYTVVTEDCNGCTLCFRIGCPAIYKSDALDVKTNRPKAWIDPEQCVGCGLCYDVCARQAIDPGAEKVVTL